MSTQSETLSPGIAAEEKHGPLIGMSSFALKVVAMVAMLIDHLKYADSEAINNFYYSSNLVRILLSYIGRLALPIFMVGIAIGYCHTRNVGRYIGRLALFGALSQLPYYLLFYRGEPIHEMDLNIMFTFVLGLLAIWGYDTLRQKNVALALVPVALAAGLAALLRTEGNWRSVLMIFAFYLLRDLPNWKKAIVWVPILLVLRARLILFAFEDPRFIAVALLNVLGFYIGVLFTFLYNGAQGPRGRVAKYAMYAFYPIHLLAIALI